MESVKNRAELQGKLGVFWHTQGSGKSFSMVFFARKVRRKISGNFTFLIITDREDLDDRFAKYDTPAVAVLAALYAQLKEVPAKEIFQQLRQVTGNYTVPEDACPTYAKT